LRYHDFASDRLESVSGGIPWDVEEFVLSEDGTRLAFVTNEGGFGVPHLLDTATREEVALPELPRGIVFAPQFSPDGKRLTIALNSATSPSDVYAIDLADATVERWTHSEVGGLDASGFTQPRLIEYPTFDRVDGKPRMIPAFYYEPAGDGPFPVVISIHGGPESQARPSFSTNTEFLVAELGVGGLVPNVRGSSGYGKRHVALDNGFQREDSVRDIGALLDWIRTQPKLDAKRVGVYGGSYGGYMVLASMARYDDRLRAGVDVVGISNFVTFLENTQEYRRDLRRAEYGDERDPAMRAHLAKISPTANAKDITIPLFVAQGANDPRVPASEAEQILASVRGNGNDDVWYLLFKDEGHGFRKKDNSDHFRAAMMRFWQEHLIGNGAS
jgi:dipeptidyl aminopeptidase/acylaminoacyl peptidase